MKKLFKSRWLYVFLFVTACLLMANVFMTAMIKRNINNERSITSEHKVIDTKTVYKQPQNEVSNTVMVEEEIKQPETEIEEQTDDGFTVPVEGDILNAFSGNDLVYSVTLKEYRVHKGIDIKAPILSKVYATANGVVESIKKDSLMGISMIIDHQNGFKSVYSNLSSTDMVKQGQSVKKGEIINGVGDTALIETGIDAHLHFELIKDGVQVNPEEYFNE
ncbi:MAG: M23 family metallopeptidase [Clostridia bacterium]|nr:M23 family metallopeptidase [Clostridia bacterium]